MGGQVKLVRAKPKAREYMPEWAKCCQQQIDDLQGSGEFTADMDDFTVLDAVCNFCNRDMGVHRAVRDVNCPKHAGYEALEVLDLDEGPVGVVK